MTNDGVGGRSDSGHIVAESLNSQIGGNGKPHLQLRLVRTNWKRINKDIIITMTLESKTQLQKNLSSIDIHVERTAMDIKNAILNLNASHSALWNLPDDQLTECLQYLLNNGLLQSVFEKHYKTAISLNELAKTAEIPERAIAKIGKEFIIDEYGTVSLPPPPDFGSETAGIPL